MNRIYPLLLLTPLMFLLSCEEPEDSVISAVQETNALLRKHTWYLEDFKVIVRNDDIPPPILFNTFNSLLSAGVYDLDDMIFDGSEMRNYHVEFSEDGKLKTRGGQIDLILDSEIGSYFVINERSIRISSAESLTYNYIYEPSKNEFSLISNLESAERLIKKINDKLVDRVANGSPSAVGDLISKILFNNEELKALINNTIVSAVAGQLDFINEIDPDELAEKLAIDIRNRLEQIDWQERLSQLIENELEPIKNIDKDAVAAAIAEQIIDFVNTKLTSDAIYDVIFPFIEQIAINSEGVTEAISILVVDLFSEIFTQENLQPILVNAWVAFTQLDEEKVGELASILTTVVQENYLSEQNLLSVLLPFTELIDSTSIFEMDNLASQTTDAIAILVNNLNAQLPDLNLSPDYVSMQNSIRLAYVGIKPVIAIIGPEQAAQDIANLILSQFLNTANINNAFISAINFLQSIDAETAGSTLTQWLLSLEDKISSSLYISIRDFLSPILDNLNPNETALNIATALNNFIIENVTNERLQNLFEPLLEEITNINAELVSDYLADLILNLDIIKDNVTKESIQQSILPVLQSVQQTNVEELAQNLIDAIVNSNLFQEIITEERVSAIISILIYKATWDNVLVANNFEEASILLTHD